MTAAIMQTEKNVEIARGDLVRAVKGEKIIQGRAFGDFHNREDLRIDLGYASPLIWSLESRGFHFKVIA